LSELLRFGEILVPRLARGLLTSFGPLFHWHFKRRAV
jgi:hypothetical protein